MMVDAVRPGSDTGLLSAAITGDEAAFDTLVGPLIESGFKLAAVMLGDGEEAQDALQEACITAWRKLFQVSAEAQLRPWFLSIVANRCWSVRRARWWSTLKREVGLRDGDLDLPGRSESRHCRLQLWLLLRGSRPSRLGDAAPA